MMATPGIDETPSSQSESQRFLRDQLGEKAYEIYLKKVEEEEQQESKPFAETPTETKLEDPTLLQMDKEHYKNKWKSSSLVLEQVKICFEAAEEAAEKCKSGMKMSVRGKHCSIYKPLNNYRRVCECVRVCFRGNKKTFANRLEKSESKLNISTFTCAKGGPKHKPSYLTFKK